VIAIETKQARVVIADDQTLFRTGLARLLDEDSRVKVEIAVARGKEQRDKRRDVVERDAKRQMERALKARR